MCGTRDTRLARLMITPRFCFLLLTAGLQTTPLTPRYRLLGVSPVICGKVGPVQIAALLGGAVTAGVVPKADGWKYRCHPSVSAPGPGPGHAGPSYCSLGNTACASAICPLPCPSYLSSSPPAPPGGRSGLAMPSSLKLIKQPSLV